MVHAISAQFPLMGGETLVLYQRSPMERYLPVARGLEVSVEPQDEVRWECERGQESSIYNRQGQMSSPAKKGVLVNILL